MDIFCTFGQFYIQAFYIQTMPHIVRGIYIKKQTK